MTLAFSDDLINEMTPRPEKGYKTSCMFISGARNYTPLKHQAFYLEKGWSGTLWGGVCLTNSHMTTKKLHEGSHLA